MLLENTAKLTLSFSISIGLSRVEEVNSILVAQLADLRVDFFLFWSVRSQPVSEAKHRYLEACLAEQAIFHLRLGFHSQDIFIMSNSRQAYKLSCKRSFKKKELYLEFIQSILRTDDSRRSGSSVGGKIVQISSGSGALPKIPSIFFSSSGVHLRATSSALRFSSN